MKNASTKPGRELDHLGLSAAVIANLIAVADESGMTLGKLAASVLATFSLGNGSALAGATGPQRLIAARRLAILQKWWRERAEGEVRGALERHVTGRFLKQLASTGRDVSRSTLYGWERRWQGGGFDGLVDGRAVKTADDSSDDPFLKHVLKLFRRRARPRLTRCYADACDLAKSRGWKTMSYNSAIRFVRSRIPVVKHRKKVG